ncbi:MAG: amidohydrolase family protein, partial [Bacteroidota bacterium]
EHPYIRSVDACYKSSKLAVDLAKKHDTRLHILHISTEKELELFRNDIPLSAKQIKAEVCIHHLWFTEEFYKEKGMFIKWNPAVKKESDREALRAALLDDRLDIIATDHAPHTLEEKDNTYLKAPSGAPLVQHALVTVLEMVEQGVLSMEKAIEKMCHAPAECFQLEKRGYIREGYFADLVLVDRNNPWMVSRENVLYKCGWSPLEGTQFKSRVVRTFVNGQEVYAEGKFDDSIRGQRLSFERE